MSGHARKPPNFEYLQKGSGLSQVVELRKTIVLSAADQLLSKAQSRFFVLRFFGLSIVLFGVAAILTSALSTSAFRTALYYGMAVPTIASFLSFLVSEWAFEQPTGIFIGVSVGAMVLRVCNLLFAFVMGLLVFKLNASGLLFGLLGTYFSLSVIEIAYFHNKGKLIAR